MTCACDYSYTCPECQAKFDARVAEHRIKDLIIYVRELHEWAEGADNYLRKLARTAEWHVDLRPVPTLPQNLEKADL